MAGLDGISTLTQVLGSLSPNGSVNGAAPVAEIAGSNPVKTGSGNSGSAVAADSTHVSSTSSLVAAALTTPDVRLDKVAELQTAIGNGSYSVSSSDVASKIVDSLLK